MKYLDCVGAYGRNYTNAAAVKADYNAGKDFRTLNGPYFSNRDEVQLKNAGYTAIRFYGGARYDQLLYVHNL